MNDLEKLKLNILQDIFSCITVMSGNTVYKESEVAQSCLTLCNPVDCSLPCFSIHGIFQARVLEWGAISFSRGYSRPSDRTWVSCIVSRCFTICATRGILCAQSKHIIICPSLRRPVWSTNTNNNKVRKGKHFPKQQRTRKQGHSDLSAKLYAPSRCHL